MWQSGPPLILIRHRFATSREVRDKGVQSKLTKNGNTATKMAKFGTTVA